MAGLPRIRAAGAAWWRAPPCGVGRSTVTEAIGEIRPMLAARGFAVPDQPGVRLRTLADVFAYAEAEDVTLRIDGTKTRVRRPQANRPGRCAFVSGKKKQNTTRPRRSVTARAAPYSPGPTVQAGCATRRPCGRKASTVPVAPEGESRGRRGLPRPGQRIPRPGQRAAAQTGRREHCTADHRAIASLVSDRAARRPTHRPQAEHRTRARPPSPLMITRQSNMQANAARYQSPTMPLPGIASAALLQAPSARSALNDQ
jgi:hypothetical protein